MQGRQLCAGKAAVCREGRKWNLEVLISEGVKQVKKFHSTSRNFGILLIHRT